jgi:hypothetical protein
MQTGTEVSVAVGMTFNLVNTATNYQSGDELMSRRRSISIFLSAWRPEWADIFINK